MKVVSKLWHLNADRCTRSFMLYGWCSSNVALNVMIKGVWSSASSMVKISSHVRLNLFVPVIVQILEEQNSVVLTLISVLFVVHSWNLLARCTPGLLRCLNCKDFWGLFHCPLPSCSWEVKWHLEFSKTSIVRKSQKGGAFNILLKSAFAGCVKLRSSPLKIPMY